MRIAYLQVSLSIQELNQLIKEFPQFLFLSVPKASSAPISKEHWSKIEILFGRRLACEDLEAAGQLKWIHTPGYDISTLCIKGIEKRGNILVTSTPESNNFQIAEFVLAAVLAFAKNLLALKEVNKFPHLVWDCKWRNSMWTLKNKVFLQIGMDKSAQEVTKRMSSTGLKVWGMNETATFFPYCSKTFSYQDMETVLPQADIVSILLPPLKKNEKWLGMKELKLMKEDSILIILGSSKCIDEDALAEIASMKKWRGILLDADYQFPVPASSKLWQIPNMIITSEVAPRPKNPNTESFKIFRYNLRHYVRGNFSEMKNVVDPSILFGIQEDEA